MYRVEHMQGNACVCVYVSGCECVCAKMATWPDVMTSLVCDADVTTGGSHITGEPNGGSTVVSWLDRSKMAPPGGWRLALTQFREEHVSDGG